MIRIYTLSDPRNNVPFYVGASKMNDTNLFHRHRVGRGMRNVLYKLNLNPKIETLDLAWTPEEARFLEEYWYQQLKAWGFKLDNASGTFRKYRIAA